MLVRLLFICLVSIMAAQVKAAEPVRLYAAGSLKAALGEVAQSFEASYTTPVATTFGPSGLLRERIEGGEPAQVFASANMKHPTTLEAAGTGGPVLLFARNKLCGLAKGDLDLTEATLLDMLLDPGLRVGTSTPKADPSGDYAFALFAKADTLSAGAREALEAKSMQLTGGPDSATPPEGRNPYAWVMDSDQADIFLTYCTNAVLAKKEVASLQIVTVPPELSVGADYGLTVLDQDDPRAWRLAAYILSPEGQRILSSYGFDANAVPAE